MAKRRQDFPDSMNKVASEGSSLHEPDPVRDQGPVKTYTVLSGQVKDRDGNLVEIGQTVDLNASQAETYRAHGVHLSEVV